LNATELLNPRCKICQSSPILKKTKHLFIDLPKLAPELQEWMDNAKKKWSDNARTMTDAWMKDGLQKRGITRDLKWGIHVPVDGYEDKVFYSWFDAPIGYIGITKENRKDWSDWWHSPNDVTLVQFMGKDNIPFHTILFPAFLIGTRDNYTLMNELSVNEFLNYEGGQFSKSRNVGVFGDDAIASGINANVFRDYLMINRPERSDSDVTWDDFQKKNNSELVANLGNLVNRTIVFLNRSFYSEIPEAALNENDNKILSEIRKIEDNIRDLALEINIKEALKEIMHISRMANQYLQENEPWKNPDPERKATCLNVLANIVKDLSILIYPYLPRASADIRKQLNIIKSELSWDDLGVLSIKSGHKILDAELLFKKIEDVDLKALKERFAGKKQPHHIGHIENDKSSLLDKLSGFEKLQLRVAKIIDVKKHPNAAKLYIEQIDLGDEQRQIISGLVPYYPEEELIGKKIIVVTNLEPANLRGAESNGMLLACEHDGAVELLTTEADIGEYVFIHKSSLENIGKLTKINIKEFSEANLFVKDHKAYCGDKELKTSKDVVHTEKISDGIVK